MLRPSPTRLPRRRRQAPRAALLIAAAGVIAGCDTAAPAPAFDGDAALARVRTQLAFGMRIPNSPAHVATGDWILAELRQRADTVIVQAFTHVTDRGDTLRLRNFIARFRPREASRVLYLTHWDSRPIAESAPDTAQRRLPTPGANDGASGVALLLGIADALKRSPPAVGVDLLFVDGEDYGSFDAPAQDVLLGSRHFAKHPPEPGYAPMFGVLFDMIGDADLQVYQEGNSMQRAPEVVGRVWDKARELGLADTFVPQGKWTVTDDHIPLLDAGMRVIDVIDLDYPYHHTPSDTPDKVSAASLARVGMLALALVR
ncbi:MAG: M28 family peptidase [Gemmatimonadetes bacterium]|nr:M28 family peptidase [Gemmatimonadota bacterium]